jgi:hypothetical protein
MPSKSTPAMPFPAMGDTFEFMQKMWGMSGMPTPANLASMAARLPQQMPSMIAPTVDVEELDKRIADLRAVEQWLELNASMLRTTIQTLEVQRATIATLKGISGAMLAPMFSQAPAPTPRANPFAAPTPEARTPFAPIPEPVAPPPEEEPAARAPRKRKVVASTPKLADDALNPAAWWHTLQDQFAKIATVASETTPPEPKKAKRPARRARKKG